MIGSVIGEGILFAEIGIELYTGEITFAELILELTVCFLLAGFILSLVRKRMRKDRGGTKTD